MQKYQLSIVMFVATIMFRYSPNVGAVEDVYIQRPFDYQRTGG